MPGNAILVNIFSGGESSELMAARVEHARVKSSCKKMLNAVGIAQGPATRRPGFRFLGYADDQGSSHDSVLLKPFVFSTIESRVLEFSDDKMSVWKDDARIDSIVTPYSDGGLRNLRLAQSGDVVYIADPYYDPRKLSRLSDTNWNLEVIDFLPATDPPPDMQLGANVGKETKGSLTYRYLVTAVDGDTGEESLPGTELKVNTYKLNSTDGNVNLIAWWIPAAGGPKEYRFYKYDIGVFGYIGTVEPDPYARNKLRAWPDPMAELGDDWPASSIVGRTLKTKTEYVLIIEAGVDGTVVIENDASGEEYGTARQGSPIIFTPADPTVVDGLTEICKVTRTDSVTKWQLTETEVFVDDNIKADNEDAPPSAEEPFSGTNNMPALVYFWEQRLGWAASFSKPFTMWLSPNAQFESLAASLPPVDSDAIEATLAAPRANGIQWVVGDRVLMAGTTGNEWSVGEADKVLTPKNVGFNPQGNIGSEKLPQLVTSDTMLVVEGGGSNVRELIYSFSSDKYDAPDISIIASHLFDGKRIVNWCYQQKPYSIAWVVLDDGSLVALTYMREHEVIGWHRHDVGGYVEDICSVPGDGYDRVYIVVRRDLAVGTKRCIEVMEDYFVKQNDPEDAFFVDSGATYDGVRTSVLTAIAPHLAGETVKVWADGAAQSDKVVESTGTVRLDHSANKVHVGLGMVSDIIPNRPELVETAASTVGKRYKVSRATIRLYRSMGVWAGPSEDEDGLEELLLPSEDNPNEPLYFTGDIDFPIDMGWEEDWNPLIRAVGPGPMTVLAAVYDVELGD